jgi:hypothetical protein
MTTPPPPSTAPACDAFDATLADYLEGALDADALAVAESHRVSCARCDALVRDLEILRTDAAQLPQLVPSRDLWSGIAARIGTPISSLEQARAHRVRSRAWMSGRAAAAALVLVTAGVTYAVVRWTSPTVGQTRIAQSPAPAVPNGDTTTIAVNPTTVAPTPRALTPAGTGTNATPVARKQSTEATYAQEIAGLHAIVEQRSAQLDPHTRAVIEHNLQVIDTAIAESRRALASDPRSGFLADQLDQALGTKLELLRTVALLPTRT